MPEIINSRNYFLVLLSLKDGPKHGYEIATHIKDRSLGHFGVSFGSLYPILHKLEKEGFVRGTWDSKIESKNKKTYTLTSEGEAALKAETLEFNATLSAFAGLMGSIG